MKYSETTFVLHIGIVLEPYLPHAMEGRDLSFKTEIVVIFTLG